MEKSVYLAGPLFSDADKLFLERMVDGLAAASGLHPVADFFLPHRDAGEVESGGHLGDVFEFDMQRLNGANVVVALLDGQDADSGTCIELGYAYARGKKIFGLITDFRAYNSTGGERHRPNLMVWGVCEHGKTLFPDIRSLAEGFAEYVKQAGLSGRVEP